MQSADDSGRLRDELARTQQDLDHARSEFSVLAGRLGHDLQGLLRNIGGFTQALLDSEGPRDARQRRWLQRVAAISKRADTLVADLVALSRVSVAQPEPQAIDLLGLVLECVSQMLPATHARAIEWELQIDPAARVQADRTLLSLAIFHLLANAVKFTGQRAVARIAVRLNVHAQGWSVEVSDNGAGFDPAYAQRLFAPLERLHGPAEFEGNGIGLATVKAVADKHGGTVHAIGAPGEGVTVTFWWPRRAVAAMQACDAAPEPDLAVPASGRRRLRLLLVDDEPLVLGTLRTMIEREGHEVVSAPGGIAGLEALDAGGAPFDAVLSDWLMPDMQGPVFARAIKERLPRIPVVLLTGQRPAVDGSYATPEHVDSVLPKPVRIADLRAMLGRLVNTIQGETKCPGQPTAGC